MKFDTSTHIVYHESPLLGMSFREESWPRWPKLSNRVATGSPPKPAIERAAFAWTSAMPDETVVTIEPFAVRPKTLAQIEDCSIAEIYKRLNGGQYESFLDGSSRLITMRSVRARQERLAKAASQPGTKPSKAPNRPGRPKADKP